MTNLSKNISNRKALYSLTQFAKEIKGKTIESAKSEAQKAFFIAQPINYFIINYIYKNEQVQEFRSFEEWKRMGAIIRKGCFAYRIWGQPIMVNDKKEYPVKFLFSRAQVYFKGESPIFEAGEDVDYYNAEVVL